MEQNIIDTIVNELKEYQLLNKASVAIKHKIDSTSDDPINKCYIQGLITAKQIIDNIINENYKITKIEVPDDNTKHHHLEKHWCMCTTLTSIRRDGWSTCVQCNGQDAYGMSPNRPKGKQKIITK